MTGQVRLAIADSVAQVTLSHPGKLNAMSRGMWQELRAVFATIQQDAALRCVVLAGEGGNFCAGGDISEYAAFRFEEASLRHFHDELVWGGLQAMLDCDVPVIAQIEGACMGAGLEIASCCDLRLASASAKFGAPIAKLGFPMAPRELALVMTAAGELSAREMLLAAAVLDAPTLVQRGFLNRVVPEAQVGEEVSASAVRVARLAPQAARLNKQSFRALAQVQRALAATDLVANAYAYAASAEHREGVTAFVDKRAPQF
ncbi:MAG: enoyl-CoA hydratase/isomerase family protein [Polaromonas sp.]|uniref:enoyl-CoA hydratase/isomerase family protein n=1 Tax=Polaromonas sp. TaxID=1869339 RepID=UPI0017AFAC76|nr:enoyl-CoA hydratase/isomerase family protein [Polaromonas sp.]MBA3594274.1 enoyl-CoA hydratase/isomerase family protein [Polaromonas sp.]